jgi:hypothetical protein
MFMGETITSQTSDIKRLILTVRDTQVLLDSDVAMLYGYETKRINETAARNKKRFPAEFRFKLAVGEVSQIAAIRSDLISLRSQIATSKRGGRRYTPYVYTEQGIGMLSGLLKNDTAIDVSIGIMNAFVEMRRFISAYGKTFERLTTVEYKLLEHDKKFDELFDLIQLRGLPQQGIFFRGQIYDAFSLIIKIISEAKKSLVIIDNYADDTILDMLSKRKSGVNAVIITSSPNRISKLALDKLNKQYPTVEIVKSDEFHDRFVIIDDTMVYHVGSSLKDAGKKCFAITSLDGASLVTSKTNDIINAIR